MENKKQIISEIQIGDTVKLNRILTVLNMQDNAIECGWFDNNQ